MLPISFLSWLCVFGLIVFFLFRGMQQHIPPFALFSGWSYCPRRPRTQCLENEILHNFSCRCQLGRNARFSIRPWNMESIKLSSKNRPWNSENQKRWPKNRPWNSGKQKRSQGNCPGIPGKQKRWPYCLKKSQATKNVHRVCTKNFQARFTGHRFNEKSFELAMFA